MGFMNLVLQQLHACREFILVNISLSYWLPKPTYPSSLPVPYSWVYVLFNRGHLCDYWLEVSTGDLLDPIQLKTIGTIGYTTEGNDYTFQGILVVYIYFFSEKQDSAPPFKLMPVSSLSNVFLSSRSHVFVCLVGWFNLHWL